MKTYENGPSGGTGGKAFTDNATDEKMRLKGILIRAGSRIDAIQIIYEKSNGTTHENPIHGGNGGKEHLFMLDDDEFITSITGRFGSEIDSLTIQTNKRTSIGYGGSGGGSVYSYIAPEGNEISGFLGRSGDRIDAIGVLFRKRTQEEKIDNIHAELAEKDGTFKKYQIPNTTDESAEMNIPSNFEQLFPSLTIEKSIDPQFEDTSITILSKEWNCKSERIASIHGWPEYKTEMVTKRICGIKTKVPKLFRCSSHLEVWANVRYRFSFEKYEKEIISCLFVGAAAAGVALIGSSGTAVIPAFNAAFWGCLKTKIPNLIKDDLKITFTEKKTSGEWKPV